METNQTVCCTQDGILIHDISTNSHKQISTTGKNVIWNLKYQGSVQDYCGSKFLSNLQNYGSLNPKRTQRYEDNRYSLAQNMMYRRCLYGKSSYTLQEFRSLDFKQKWTLFKNHKKTQQLLNLSKWHRANKITEYVITKTFDKIGSNLRAFLNIGTDLTLDDNVDINFEDMATLGKDNILPKMIETGILPANFNNIR